MSFIPCKWIVAQNRILTTFYIYRDYFTFNGLNVKGAMNTHQHEAGQLKPLTHPKRLITLHLAYGIVSTPGLVMNKTDVLLKVELVKEAQNGKG